METQAADILVEEEEFLVSRGVCDHHGAGQFDRGDPLDDEIFVRERDVEAERRMRRHVERIFPPLAGEALG